MTEHICPRCGLHWDCGIDCGIKMIVGCGRTVCIGIQDKLDREEEATPWWKMNLKITEIKFVST